MKKLIFYREQCIGCGVCYEQQPATWRLSKKDGKAVLVNGQQKKQVYVAPIPALLVPSMRRVAEACPARIIKLEN